MLPWTTQWIKKYVWIYFYNSVWKLFHGFFLKKILLYPQLIAF